MSRKKAELFVQQEEMREIMLEDVQDGVKHGILVSRLAALTARELNESEEFIQQIALAGMLHDIGKLRLSKYLYGRKKDVLGIEEMRYMRMHSAYSYEIAKEEGFPEEVQQMVYHHHENYDGSGYPDNLKGKDIPKGARILRTCDVFAALVSKRPYRDAFDIETAVELMIDEVKNFDMEVFLAFQKVVNGENRSLIEMLIEHNNRPEAYQEWMPMDEIDRRYYY